MREYLIGLGTGALVLLVLWLLGVIVWTPGVTSIGPIDVSIAYESGRWLPRYQG